MGSSGVNELSRRKAWSKSRCAGRKRLYRDPEGWRNRGSGPGPAASGAVVDNACTPFDDHPRPQRLPKAGHSFLYSLKNTSYGSAQRPPNMQLSAFLASAALATTSLAQQCYYPSGKVGTADIPCSTSSENAHCCGKTGICLSNWYCMETSEESGPLGLYRGSCTDRDWGSSCPQECLGGKLVKFLGIL